ncbi:MAG: RNA binding S1 domain protein [Parcubacteria group bacterium GW2011_GWA2_52_8]|nr:MAG: RNA binding S1 domain protein [Parcubacteria group bacterium GW2011_GWA2_52_8]
MQQLLEESPNKLRVLRENDVVEGMIKVYASVIDIENRDGNIELSFRKAGQERVWQTLKEKLQTKETVHTKILEANKGGLMVRINNVLGFLPVSQLAPSHYPRVEDGDKNKILSVLKGFVGQDFDVRIITAEPEGEKLIVSERAVLEDQLIAKISKLTIGSVVEGVVTGVVDFGAFVKFDDEMEGLVHISELAWQRIEDPRNIVKVGDRVKAQIIAIENDRISLSMKRLQKDPWEDAVKKYQIGQVVKGKVLKLAPFGAFIELDQDIHGLAHIGELAEEKIADPSAVLKEGEEKEFKIISIEPREHRLGLSLKAVHAPMKPPTPPPQAAAEPSQPEAAPAAS